MPRELVVAVIVAPFRVKETIRPATEAPPLVFNVADSVIAAEGFAVVVPV